MREPPAETERAGPAPEPPEDDGELEAGGEPEEPDEPPPAEPLLESEPDACGGIGLDVEVGGLDIGACLLG